MSVKKRGLGRGLDALLATSNQQLKVDSAAAETLALKGELQRLPIEFLQPGKYQPRNDIGTEALEELAASIRSQGVIQPIVVRPITTDQYEIIAGERRWRASQLAELDQVPCIIKDVADEAAIAIALIENIQREDLNAMEEAQALQRLLHEFELTHQQVAAAVGKSRTAVTNILRLNNLHHDVKQMLERSDIEMGHARALLALDAEQQSEAAKIVAQKAMTVREAEQLVRKMQAPPAHQREKITDPDVKRLETSLADNLGAPVSISHNAKGKGKLVISFADLEQLDGILTRIKHEN